MLRIGQLVGGTFSVHDFPLLWSAQRMNAQEDQLMRKSCVLLTLAALAVMSGFADRPRDPWVFRCVLDKNPRMVVIALHEHLWVAYDTTTCSLYKAWDGDVKFQGAVYDDIHGPQPETRGEVYDIKNFQMALRLRTKRNKTRVPHSRREGRGHGL
jgi:hypothetical protein